MTRLRLAAGAAAAAASGLAERDGRGEARGAAVLRLVAIGGERLARGRREGGGGGAASPAMGSSSESTSFSSPCVPDAA